MLVNGKSQRTIWVETKPETRDGARGSANTDGTRGEVDTLVIIDQTLLPHQIVTTELHTVDDVCRAISDMLVRGAGLIGATAGYGVWVAAKTAPAEARGTSAEQVAAFQLWQKMCAEKLRATRPTASNLAWALRRQEACWRGRSQEEALVALRREADAIADEDADFCRRIGEHGKEIIAAIAAKKAQEAVAQGKAESEAEPVHILTHCNAGWLAFVDYGSALSPIYAAQAAGIKVHVWVDETRPRNQGASLTAWELGQQGVPHDIIADNVGGHLMQHGMVDMVITGADRVTRCGDAANKIGTYLKALAAKDNGVPFYVALPSSTFDFTLCDGVAGIPIEERSAAEVRVVSGKAADGTVQNVLLCPETSTARNWAFDVTPARLIRALITERGVCEASEDGVLSLFADKYDAAEAK